MKNRNLIAMMMTLLTPVMLFAQSVTGKVTSEAGDPLTNANIVVVGTEMGTVSNDISEAVKLAKSGQIHYKADKNGIVQAGVGKLSFGSDKICQNIESFIENIKKSRPSGSKGTFIKKISISSTMGVSLNCEVN